MNSGLLPLGPTPPPAFSMTFDKTGSFPYYCVIHPNMIGTVKVVKSGGKIDSAEPPPSAGQGRAGEVDRRRAVREEEVGEDGPSPVKNADGSSTYPIEMGASDGPHRHPGVQPRADGA